MINNSNKILILSQVFFPDTVSVSQHLTDLVESLIAHGYTVHVITGNRNYENPSIRYKSKDFNDRLYIERLMYSGFSKNTKIGRLLNFLTFNIRIICRLIVLRSKNYVGIIGLTAPPLLSFFGVIYAKVHNKKFVYWAMDLQPELAITSGYIAQNSLAARFLQKLADFIYKNSNLTIALDRFMKEHIVKRSSKANVAVLPVWPVVDQIYLGSRLDNPFRKRYNFGNKIVVMYSGNHSILHPLTTLLDAAEALIDDSRFLFVHIGGGVQLAEIKKRVNQRGLKNVVILPFQPRNTIHLSLGSADIHVVSMGEKVVGLTHPNKIYGSLFLGKPVLYLGPKESHITEILDCLPGNISVCHGETLALINSLYDFAGIGHERSKIIGLNNMNFADTNFNPEILRVKMVDEIRNVFNT